jgi:hypothetical protein
MATCCANAEVTRNKLIANSRLSITASENFKVKVILRYFQKLFPRDRASNMTPRLEKCKKNLGFSLDNLVSVLYDKGVLVATPNLSTQGGTIFVNLFRFLCNKIIMPLPATASKNCMRIENLF